MIGGFFPASDAVSKSAVSLIPKCGVCGLHKTCISPKMQVTGQGKEGILIVAEAPGKQEDEQNQQLVGEAGQLLRESMRKFGFDLDRDCWKTNSLICRPPENRTPSNNEIDYCRPNLYNTIAELSPRMIIPLGAVAVRSLIGPLWRENVGSMGQWAGWRIPLQETNTWIAPNYHPSYVLHAEGEKSNTAPVVRIWFERNLQRALELSGRPWVTIPDYRAQVRVIFDPNAAAAWIRERIASGGVFAFDYETDRLKPDHPEARIVSCSICWNGIETIAYPWVGEAIVATGEFLQCKSPKIGANNKFEDRWTRRMFGFGVENWVHDVVLDAHILDNREGITSVKFSAFTQLGFPPWNEHIHPFLEADGGNKRNRIHEIDLHSLLMYNGLDAIVEFELAKVQRKAYQNNENCASAKC